MDDHIATINNTVQKAKDEIDNALLKDFTYSANKIIFTQLIKHYKVCYICINPLQPELRKISK